ncbi:MAG: hypothetical protein H6806_03680 [Planctomycetes bacterium]|nr:hypothetical protein [Planctomycetota bacterium]MCB9828854.1 hypothetical protein [Planctomycetota bacterium]
MVRVDAPLPPRAVAFALEPAPKSPVAGGLGHAFASWRTVLVVVVVQLLLAATVVLPWGARLMDRTARHAHAPALGGEPDAHDRAYGHVLAGPTEAVLREIEREEAPTLEALERVQLLVVLLAWVVGAFAAGAFLGTSPGMPGAPRGGGTIPAREALAAGGRHVFAMLRVGIVFAVLLVIAWRLVFETWGAIAGVGEAAQPSARVAWWGERWREVAAVAAFFWLRVAADAARADLVRGRRRSAWIAILAGLLLPFRHPIALLGLAVPVALLAWGVPWALGYLLPVLEAPHAVGHLTVFLVLQVAVAACWFARAAWLAGVAVLRA